MKKDALRIVKAAIKAADPYENTKRILEGLSVFEEINVIALGKAAVPMAQAAEDVFGGRIKRGLLVTKYQHSEGFSSPFFEIIEASHPVSDENSELAAEKGLEIARELTEKDCLIVLISGGGSALFEKSRVSFSLQREITEKLLKRGADIRSINAIRKRLSSVKGGRLAETAYPARVISVALSDVLSNDKSVIASGPTVPDSESEEFIREALASFLPEYERSLDDTIFCSRSGKINDGGYYFAGDINILCEAAGEKARELGYTVFHGRRDLSGEASSEAVSLIKSIPRRQGKCCYIFGGETVVNIKGTGKGGRNQEMALSAAIEIKGRKNIAFISLGSDGTDGPTDAAGGFSDGNTYERIKSAGLSPENELMNNNSYYALKNAGDLIITGPTGTNVNDITVILTDYD
ncbi:MAG: DUF4147 domain-containing protein [Clostridia bacterium]|nr:DUF4147 domain-containing protein [Clostridia bacterium]